MSPLPSPKPFPPETTAPGRDADPLLQQAMEEIKEILDRHNIGAYFLLQSPHYAEYLIHFPNWTCAHLTKEGVRFRAKLEDFPTREDQIECVTATTGMVLQFTQELRRQAINFEYMTKLLGEHFDIGFISKRKDLD